MDSDRRLAASQVNDMQNGLHYPSMFKGKYVTRIGRKYGAEAFRIHEKLSGAKQRCKYDNPIERQVTEVVFDMDADDFIVSEERKARYPSELWYANPDTGRWEEIEWWKM